MLRGVVAPAPAGSAMASTDGKPGELSSEALAARAQAGDRASFDELVVRLRPSLRAFLARRLPREADADDLAQETFLRAYQHLDRYDPGRRFSTWLFTIGKNVAANHRVSERRREELAAPRPERAAAPAAHGGEDQLWRAARRALGDEAFERESRRGTTTPLADVLQLAESRLRDFLPAASA